MSMVIPRMVVKDRRLARYPDFKAWSSQAGFLFPNVGAMLCMRGKPLTGMML